MTTRTNGIMAATPEAMEALVGLPVDDIEGLGRAMAAVEAVKPTFVDTSAADRLAECFPVIAAPHLIYGDLVMVQMRLPPKMMGSLRAADSSRDAEKWNCQVGRVLAFGRKAASFWDDHPIEERPAIGSYVRTPLVTSGDRQYVPNPNPNTTDDDKIIVSCFTARSIIGLCTEEAAMSMTFYLPMK